MRVFNTPFLGTQRFRYCISRDRLELWRKYIQTDKEVIFHSISVLTNNLFHNEKIDPLDFHRVAVLEAHLGMDIDGRNVGGTNEGNSWTYVERRERSDSYTIRRVQDWVDRHDGGFDLLVVGVCNKNNREKLTSRKSVLVHSTDNFYWADDHPSFFESDYLKVIDPVLGTY